MYPDVREFLNRITSPDAAVRQAAVKDAPNQNPEVLAGLADYLAHPDKAIAKAARAAMERFVHSKMSPEKGKGRPNSGIRDTVAENLLAIAASSRPRIARAYALTLYGFAGNGSAGEETILNTLEKDKEIGEDARMARQRVRMGRY
jgi:hypothetical protein